MPDSEIKTCASLFSGGGGWELGAREAGLTPLWAVEYDAKHPEDSAAIANAYEENVGAHVIRQSADAVDIAALISPDLLFISPPCQGYSQARNKKLPPRGDEEVGIVTVEYARILKPKVILLENVTAYRHSKTFKAIEAGLIKLGYNVRYRLLNAADYGVPQTRKRLIMAATRADMPTYTFPTATHRAKAVTDLFGTIPAWLSWHKAIEDLIPTLPKTELADWQISRLLTSDQFNKCLITPNNAAKMTLRGEEQTSVTIRANSLTKVPHRLLLSSAVPEASKMSACLVPGDNSSGNTLRAEGELSITIRAKSIAQVPHRLLIDTQHTKRKATVRDGDSPMPTLTVGHATRPSHLKILIDGISGTVRAESEPITTLTASLLSKTTMPRLLVGQQKSGIKGIAKRGAEKASLTVTAGNSDRLRLLEGFEVLQLTVQALGRLQTFPDWYKFPQSKGVACKLIGNAVPPKLAKALIEQLLLERGKLCS
jgi:DNA-cytosine methyltransferase